MRRLRAFPSEAELAQIYSQPYDHKRWEDHKQRVAWTRERLFAFFEGVTITHIVDPACGDGAITEGANENIQRSLGDLVYATHLDVIGPLETTMSKLSTPGARDTSLLVLTEVIEHVEDPAVILRVAHYHYGWLLLTTPINETVERHANPEHIWAWSQDEMRELLEETGWNIRYGSALETFFYDYQLWICER